MITLFEDFKNPDLRRIGKFVLCIKDYEDKFTEGKYYKVRGYFGDPQGAIEKYGINDYLPVECIYRIKITDNDGDFDYFKIKIENDLPSFFEYFEIPEFSDEMDKMNI